MAYDKIKRYKKAGFYLLSRKPIFGKTIAGTNWLHPPDYLGLKNIAFTTSNTKLSYFHQKLNMQVISWVNKQLETES